MFRIPNQADATYPLQAGLFSADVDTLASGLAGDGVLAGLGVAAQSTPDMTVAVSAGQARIGGYFPFEAGENVTIATADSTHPRIDLVVMDHNGVLSRVGGTAAASPVCPAVPANSIPLALVYVPAGVTAITNAMLVDKRPVVADYFDRFDDFEGGALATSGNISTTPWGTSASGTAANAFQAGENLHPGIFRLVTGATSGNNSRLHLGASATAVAPVLPANLARTRFLLRIPTVTTLAIKAGWGVDMSDAAAGSLGTAGAFVEFVPATSLKWRYVTRQAGASTTNADTGADVAASTWYQFDIVRLPNGNWQFAKNGVLAFTHSANQPTTACTFGFLVHTLTTALRNLDIDLAGWNYAPLGNRWT